MIPILAVLALFVVQTLLAPSLRYLAGPGVVARLTVAMGPRDTQPPESPLVGRAARALANLQEALPVFVTIALLHELHGTSAAIAPYAWGFFAARALYVPAYLSGVPGVRSVVWMASWVGLGGMIAGLG